MGKTFVTVMAMSMTMTMTTAMAVDTPSVGVHNYP